MLGGRLPEKQWNKILKCQQSKSAHQTAISSSHLWVSFSKFLRVMTEAFDFSSNIQLKLRQVLVARFNNKLFKQRNDETSINYSRCNSIVLTEIRSGVTCNGIAIFHIIFLLRCCHPVQNNNATYLMSLE